MSESVDTTTVVPGSDEYNQQMATLGEQVAIQNFSASGQMTSANVPDTTQQPAPADTTTSPAGTDSQRPEWLPEKFKTPEEMAKSYAELERKLSGGDAQPNQQTPPADTQDTTTPTGDTNSSPVDIGKFQQEFIDKGQLSPESYDALAKAGLNKDLVDSYISGQLALRASVEQAAFSLVGGKDQYISMVNWAKGTLSSAEITAFNQAVTNGNQDVAHLAIKGLEAKYVAANGRQATTMLNGGANPTQSLSGYQSHAEVTAAINDPRYAADPAYRKSVEAKIAATPDNFFLARQGF